CGGSTVVFVLLWRQVKLSQFKFFVHFLLEVFPRNRLRSSMDYGLTQSQVGVSAKETETQIVAREFEANIVEFDNLEQMQRNLTSGNIGQVLVDRNTAFHFLDKSGLKRNRQIRLIRNIDYPMDYF
ncbi:unnamed protein product, partial [Porites lobata]